MRTSWLEKVKSGKYQQTPSKQMKSHVMLESKDDKYESLFKTMYRSVSFEFHLQQGQGSQQTGVTLQQQLRRII